MRFKKVSIPSEMVFWFEHLNPLKFRFSFILSFKDPTLSGTAHCDSFSLYRCPIITDAEQRKLLLI